MCQCIRNNDFSPISEAYHKTSGLEVLDFVNHRVGEVAGLGLLCIGIEAQCIFRGACAVGTGISLVGRVIAGRTATRAMISASKTEAIAVARNIIPIAESTSANVIRQSVKYDINALSRAGQVIDRGGLTKAGRALDKHGGRPGSVFPKATGNPANKNMQGQYHLDDILTHPSSKSFKDGIGYEIYAPDGRGVYFKSDGSLRGFINEKFRKSL